LTGFALTALKGAKHEKEELAKKEEEKEDPIQKAEREFFAVVKKVINHLMTLWKNYVIICFQEQELRLEARRVKAEADS